MAQTSEEGYDCGDRGWLSQEEIEDISKLMWEKQAADAIMFHQFASIATQTMIRPEELLQLRRRNTWLSESSDYNAKAFESYTLSPGSPAEQVASDIDE